MAGVSRTMGSLLLSRLLLLFTIVLGHGVCSAFGQTVPELDTDPAAVAAYRAGDLSTARTLWSEALESSKDLSNGERARICYNLGNVCARQGEPMQAVAWYSASLRLRPRDADTWANLELSRLAAELPAADRGDLGAALQRLLDSLTLPESSWLALLSLLPLAVALGFEATRGGSGWRWSSLLCLVLAVLGGFPWLNHQLQSGQVPLMVIADGPISIRSEPRVDGDRLDELEPGDVAQWHDEMGGWTSVKLSNGRVGWLPSPETFQLNR
jgi:tetratricopeptide (TPR) repeat protein